MILLQVNTTANWGSTGKIAEQIGEQVMRRGGKSYIAYGYYANNCRSELIKIGSDISIRWHVRFGKWFDKHGLLSRIATNKLIRKIDRIKPDIIHLHNLHGYFINYKILFEYLNQSNIPVVWTLHDCWSFTGRCAHYMLTGCEKWKSTCYDCLYRKTYPKTYIDRSARNHALKRELFTSLGERLTLVPVSEWLAGDARQSFFANTRIHTIHNGIDINTFRNTDKLLARKALGLDPGKRIIIGVASAWGLSKGINDFYKLREMLPAEQYDIILVGLMDKQLETLPEGIIGIKRTQNAAELALYYSAADVFFNPTYADNYPTTNLEAIACGTPCLTYRTGGSPESITENTGYVVEQGDLEEAARRIDQICSNGKEHYSEACRKHAEQNFDKRKCYEQYIKLYNEILTNNKK